MIRLTIRDLKLAGIVSVVTTVGMYCAWQTDRAEFATRFRQMQHRAELAESQKMPDLEPGQAMVMTRSDIGKYTIEWGPTDSSPKPSSPLR